MSRRRGTAGVPSEGYVDQGMDDAPDFIADDHPYLAAQRRLYGMTPEIREALDEIVGTERAGHFTCGIYRTYTLTRSWGTPLELEELVRARRVVRAILFEPLDEDGRRNVAVCLTRQRIQCWTCTLAFDIDRDRLWSWELLEPSPRWGVVHEIVAAFGARAGL